MEPDYGLLRKYLQDENVPSWREELKLLEPLFDLLGHWLMSIDFLSNLSGLLTGREIVNAVKVLARQ